MADKSERAERDEQILSFWKENKIFEKSLEKPSPKGEFVFYDGPPFATGLPHAGSLLSSVIKDVIPRYKTMKGHHVRRRWGWDCHGLPIENMIEKELGIKDKTEIEGRVGIKAFNEACRSSVLRYAQEWKKYVDRVGRWVEYDNAYKTMDNTFIESVWHALKEIHNKGLLYEGRKVLLYCPHCQTPIAKAEIAMDNSYKDVTEESVYVKFKIKDFPNAYFLAWTTTPWTLPGNVALAVGEDVEYVEVKVGAEIFVVAKDRLSIVAEPYEVVAEHKGREMVGMQYEPLFDIPAVKDTGKKAFYVTSADFVNTEEGTGIVHTAVIYGEDDYNLGLKLDLPMVPLLDNAGHFNTQAPELIKGQYFKKAEKVIKEDLEKRSLLFKKEMHTHSYPHCHRCGTALLYNAISSWFINIQEVKNKMIKLNEKINWVPEHLKHGRFLNIVENAPDWTISRNRYWASPLPIWKCEKCNALEIVGSIEELKERSGGKTPANDRGELDLHRPYIDEITFDCKCGGAMKRIPEVIDGWVESGSMPFAEYHYPFENKKEFESRFPGDFVAEYIAQTRTWFYYMHTMATILFNDVAFKNVVSTGNVQAKDGSKMSKSKGNYTDPLILLDQMGADAFRYYLMSSVVMQSEDVSFKDEEVKEVHNRLINILWNSFNFYQLYADGTQAHAESEHVLDKWILSRLHELISEIESAMDAYDMVRASRPIRDFVTDLSTWYVRRSRDRFRGEGEDKRNALATTRFVFQEFSKVVAPIMPFIAEDIYRKVRNESSPESVHLCEWPKAHEGLFSKLLSKENKILEGMAETRRITSLALEARSKANIKVRQPLTNLRLKTQDLGEEYLDIIKDEVNVKKVVVDPNIQNEVELNTELTPELVEEGELRDVIRAIQDWRKEQGLNPHDTVDYAPSADKNDFFVKNKTAIEKVTNVRIKLTIIF